MCRHCWNDSWEKCEQWLDKFPNSVIGITNLVTQYKAKFLRDVIEKVDIKRLILETDAPYFPPKFSKFEPTSRPSFSIPVDIINVAEEIAKIKGCTREEVLRISRQNVRNVYNI